MDRNGRKTNLNATMVAARMDGKRLGEILTAQAFVLIVGECIYSY